jgi:hypothetical protein
MTEIYSTRTSDQALITKYKNRFNASLKEIEDRRDNITANKKYGHYYDMPSHSVGQNLEVERLLSSTQDDINNCNHLENILAIQDANLERINNIALEAKKIATRAMNHIGKGGINLQENMQGLISALENELSGNSFGLSLWSGSRPTTEKATLSLLSGPGAEHNSNYYLGDNSNNKLYLNGQERTYGFNAGSEVIANLIEGLKEIRDSQVGFDIIKYPNNNPDTPYSVADGASKLDLAMSGLSEYQQHLGMITQEVKLAKEKAENSFATLSDLYADNLNGLKMEDLPTQLMELQLEQNRLATQLQMTVKFIKDFNINDYL